MSADSMVFCIGFDSITDRCEGGWLSDGGKTSEARVAPGVEHAAHCIGYVYRHLWLVHQMPTPSSHYGGSQPDRNCFIRFLEYHLKAVRT